MAEVVKKISSPEFNADKYVKEISQVCIGGLELQKHKTAILALSERTNQSLKRNVYQNYMQFIETAREISHLEGEMYQLSHVLSEQRRLLAGMGSGSGGPRGEEEDVEQSDRDRQDKETLRTTQLALIEEQVQDCIRVSEMSGREVVHEGDLVELDLVESTALQRCRAFLLSDILIITSWISNRRGGGGPKYKYEAAYELGSLAVVNVRDLGQVKHAFKLLVFPDTRLFQCSNQQSKETWLTKMDEAKRAKMKPEKKSEVKQPPSSDSKQDDSSDSQVEGLRQEEGESETSRVEWVMDSPEELDVLIAQRHFDSASQLISRVNAFLDSAPHTSTNLDIRTKVEGRVKWLTRVLLGELSVSSDKSMQGGLRASRRAVKLLNHLGYSNQACELYLKLCSSVLKSQTKRVKREFATVAYVTQLATVFFSNLADITTEFQLRAFPKYPSCAAAYVVWASREVTNFTNGVVRQAFVPQTALDTLAQCVHSMRTHADKVREVGLDVVYLVESGVGGGVGRAITDAADKLVEASKLRAVDDPWTPTHLSKQALHKLQADWARHGLPPLNNYLTGDGWLELTSNTIQVTSGVMGLVEGGLTLVGRAGSSHVLASCLHLVLHTHLSLIPAPTHPTPQRGIIEKNGGFLVEHLVRVANEKYNAQMGESCHKLEALTKEFGPRFKTTTRLSSVTGYI